MKKITIFLILFCMWLPYIFAEETNNKETVIDKEKQTITETEQENKKDVNGLNLATNAKSAILLEASTGKIIYEKNTSEQLPMASMTKMMTLLLIMEEIEKGNLKWDELVTTSEHASSMGGSQIFLETGEQMTVEDLVKGICIASGNDAAVIKKQLHVIGEGITI